jgi:inner membrane protease ATP23
MDCNGIISDSHKDIRIGLILQHLSLRPEVSCDVCDEKDNATAYLIDSTPNKIVVCSNKNKNMTDIHDSILHEMIHSYDYHKNPTFFSTCEGLAHSEVRAAKYANCNKYFPFDFMKKNCILNQASNSTNNMYSNNDGGKCVKKVFDQAMHDDSPFK